MKFIPENHTGSHTLLVTETMTVDFGTDIPRLGKLHPVCSTYTLGKHIELVSRKLILPFLEEHEEAIGFELSVKHIAPAPVGSKLKFAAKYVATKGTRIDCNVQVYWFQKLIAKGSTTQVLKDRAELKNYLENL